MATSKTARRTPRQPRHRNHPRAAAQRRSRACAAGRRRSLVVPAHARRVYRCPSLRGPAPSHGRFARHAHGSPQRDGGRRPLLPQPVRQRAEPARISPDREGTRVLPGRALHVDVGEPLGRRVRLAAQADPHGLWQVPEPEPGLRALRNRHRLARHGVQAGPGCAQLPGSADDHAPPRKRGRRRMAMASTRRCSTASTPSATAGRHCSSAPCSSACIATTTSMPRSASRPTSLPTGCVACWPPA